MQNSHHHESTPAVGLCLADGASWNIVAENPEAELFIKRLAGVMGLSSANGVGRKLAIQVQEGEGADTELGRMPGSLKSLFGEALADYPWEEECSPLKVNISCNLYQHEDENHETLQLIHLSSVFVLDAVTRGGMLLHGALIEREGMGMILAGPGGVGKTTACSRLPEPWQVLSDDITLIVRDRTGKYWAHPWPTWSRFTVEKVGGSWDVGRGIELQAICFLNQSQEMDMVYIGKGEMVCLTMESIEQANRLLRKRLKEESFRKLSNLHFRNVCKMVESIRGYHLSLDLETHFWEFLDGLLGVEIGRNLDER